MALKIGKIQKLTIKAYSKVSRSAADLIDSFEAPYNPDSFSQKYEIEYSGKHKQSYNSSKQAARYQRSKPKELNIKLVLDDTRVDQMGLALLKPRKSVSEQVKKFVDLTFRMNGAIHEPNYLVAEWGGKEDGGLIFACRLGSVDVKYTSFNRDGSPLRAELDIVLVGDQAVARRMKDEGKESPDLTHSRVVKSGDTLPLLTKEIYGSSNHYLRVAQVNNLDNFRDLTPGQELVFPPFEKK